MEILSAEELYNKNETFYNKWEFAEIYSKYLLEKQAEYISSQFGVNSGKAIIEVSNEFIKKFAQ